MRLAQHIKRPFDQYIKPKFAGQPIAYLELGVFEGASAAWMLTHILTHSFSTADLVDPWVGYEAEPKRDGSPRIYTQEQMDRCYASVCQVAKHHQGRVQTFRMTSTEYLDACRKKYDLILVDGLHTYEGVLNDAIGAYHALKCCGWMVFDDYNLQCVQEAVERFTSSLHKANMEVVYTTRSQQCLQIGK
jgi:predicted O-methyltransferase YrrM